MIKKMDYSLVHQRHQTFPELYIQRVEEIHVYRMINKPRLWFTAHL